MTWLKLLWAGIPLPYKLVAVAGVIAGIFLFIRWRDNRIRAEGKLEGKAMMADTLVDQLKTAQKEKLAEIAKREVAWTAATKALERASSELQQSRAADQAQLEQDRAVSRALWEANREGVKDIPVSELNDRIRSQSSKLAATQTSK